MILVDRVVYAANLGDGIVQRTRVLRATLAPPEIRSLNSVPLDLVVPATPTTLIVVGELLWVGAVGSVPYSAAPAFQIGWFPDATTMSFGNAWDGSALVRPIYTPSVWGDQIGLSPADIPNILGNTVKLTSTADVTGGDAPCTIRLTYTDYTKIL